MGTHSREPWRIGQAISDTGGQFNTIETENLDEICGEHCPGEEDARRIVACVNACAGYATDALESLPTGGLEKGRLRSMAEQTRLIIQRDNLLYALKRVVKIADRETVEFIAARAAIAMAEGRENV